MTSTMSRGKKILALMQTINRSNELTTDSFSTDTIGSPPIHCENPPSAQSELINTECSSDLLSRNERNEPTCTILQNVVLKSPRKSYPNKRVENSIYNVNNNIDPYDVFNWTDSDELISPPHSEYVPDDEEVCSDSENGSYGLEDLDISPKIREELLSDYATVSSEFDNFRINTNLEYEYETGKMNSNDFEASTSKTIETLNHFQLNAPGDIGDNDKTNEVYIKNKRRRFPDNCYFCETSVLNFARHLRRNHSYEPEVQKIYALKPNDLKRKRMIDCLRKRGNHLKNFENCVKPVKKSHVFGRKDHECVPCKYCLGYYRPEQLWRHVNKCPQNPGEKTKFSHKTDAQNVLISHLPIDQKLKETVFPRMLADKISLVAKKDPLIRKYGAQYLTSHREKHHVNVCSREMRELAKMLIEIEKLHPSVKSLYDALQPIYFDSFVEAAKIVAGYDASKEEYASATFAMNISTSLKECCSLAIRMTLKRRSYNCNIETAELEANFNTFQQLLVDSWKFEVSSVAAACLNTRKWNKLTIVPLASDIKLFRSYLIEIAENALKDLETCPENEKAYKLLLEVAYCRSMLLNRKRGGELQRMPLDLYKNMPKHQSYEEFNDAISPTEQILLKKFKRVVTRGKRGRGVPVLFSIDVQEYLQVLIASRDKFVKTENIYLFPKLLHDTPITGYKVMQKHAKRSGLKNPDAITSTRLRKHLATMSQIFELSPSDIEQLATFMGHTTDVHKQVYRLPDDVFQTAKIAKLLILMETGKAGEYKGKSLDEIKLDLEEELHEDSDEEVIEEVLEQNTASLPVPTTQNRKRKLVPWTPEQKNVAKQYFKSHIAKNSAPKRKEIEDLKEKYPGVFDNKTWQQIKVFIQNIYRTK